MYRHLLPLFAIVLALQAYGAEEEVKDWEVSNPPGEWRDITITTDTTTWSFVDVSPNGEHVVFDLSLIHI